MPIYEFHCADCERDSEVLVRSSRWKGTKCPHCGSEKLVKKLSVFSSSVSSSAGTPACGMSACEGAGTGACGCCCAGGKHHH